MKKHQTDSPSTLRKIICERGSAEISAAAQFDVPSDLAIYKTPTPTTAEPTAPTVTRQHIEILHHTVHLAAGGCYCGGGEAMDELVAWGMMQSAGRKSFVPGEYFRITAAGRTALVLANEITQNALQLITELVEDPAVPPIDHPDWCDFAQGPRATCGCPDHHAVHDSGPLD